LDGSGSSLRLRLLSGFAVFHDGRPVDLPMGAQRVIALLALHNRPLQRDYIAGMLWLDTPDERAAANLRSTLWRIQQRVDGLLEARGTSLRLGASVTVDLREAEVLARGELDGRVSAWQVDELAGDLLPDWYDDWVVLERERFRQLRLQALESLCDRHIDRGDLGKALDAALATLLGEPLRESAHRAVIRVHLASGNLADALRQYSLCRRLLREHLDVEPSPQLTSLIGDAAVMARRDAPAPS